MKKNPQVLIIALFAVTFLAAVAFGLCLRAKNAEIPAENPASVSDSDFNFYSEPPATSSPQSDLPTFTDKPPMTEPPVSTMPETFLSEISDATIPANEPTDEEPQSSDGDGIITLCIGGDTSVNGEFADFAALKSPDYPWEDVAEIMSAADISAVNLETCVSDRGVSEKKEGYGFETPPEMLEGFKNAGIDIVNLANNHTRDYGIDALSDTFKNLTDYGIKYFGAGSDLDEAEGLTVIERDGVKVGFTGANRVYLPPDCAAGEDHPGINMIGDKNSETAEAFCEKIAEYDSECDVLIVFLHAGEEHIFEATDYQKTMSRKFVDAGADIVIGGHSHTLQPIEFYKGKPLIYSIGNFIFWHTDDEIDGLSALFEFTLDKNGFRGLKLHPLFIKNYKVNYLYDGSGSFPTRYRQIIELMNQNCAPYGTAFDDGGELYTLN